MATELVIKYIICIIGILITTYNCVLIKRKTKPSKTTKSLLLCCIIHYIVSLLVIISLALDSQDYHKYLDYVSLEIIIFSLCIQILVWLSWFKVFRMQFAYLFSTELLYVVLNYISFSIYIIAATITFISFFQSNGKVIGIKRCYVISMLVLWFSLVELVISISTFILNYKKHLNWVKLREQQLQKLASINPTPLRMIPENEVSPMSPISEDITRNSHVNVNGSGDDVAINVGPVSTSNTKIQLEVQKSQRTSQLKASNENLKVKGGSDSVNSLTGSISKKSCLSYECIDKTILHYMHDKSVDFANSDPRATENNIKLITILHVLIYIFHGLISILILIVLLFDWKYSLQLLLLYTQTEITIKLQDHFLLRQFIDLSLT